MRELLRDLKDRAAEWVARYSVCLFGHTITAFDRDYIYSESIPGGVDGWDGSERMFRCVLCGKELRFQVNVKSATGGAWR